MVVLLVRSISSSIDGEPTEVCHLFLLARVAGLVLISEADLYSLILCTIKHGAALVVQ